MLVPASHPVWFRYFWHISCISTSGAVLLDYTSARCDVPEANEWLETAIADASTVKVNVELKSNGGGRMHFNQLIASGSTTLNGVDSERAHAITMHLQPPPDAHLPTKVLPPASITHTHTEQNVFRISLSDFELLLG